MAYPKSKPFSLRRFPFGGTVGAAKQIIGATGDANADLTIPGLTTLMVPVIWAIWNTDSTDNLYVRNGPHAGAFTAAAAAVLDNYATLLPGGGYEDPMKNEAQLGDLLLGSVRDANKYLLVMGSAAGVTFSGYVWAWVPE